MKLTNKLNLPDAFYRAVKADPYSKGDANFSVTELIAPARQRALMKKHEHEIEEDVADRLWSLYGQLMHLMLERANNSALVETRFKAKFGDYTVSGQIDSLCLEQGVLVDYKFTTAWGFMANRPPKEEWIQQLNMQLEILRQNGLDAKRLEIVGALRDWQLAKSKTDKNYPNFQMAKHEIPIWPRDKTVFFINERIWAHVEARKELPECSRDETWNGRRCSDYCSVNKFCTQYMKGKK